MGDIDMRAARERIENVERRIAAMQDAGVDTAALRAQLAFAHHALRDGRLSDTEAICDEVMDAARRLAERGSRSSQPHPAIRTPAHGTPAPSAANRESGTEALQRVKVGRAQLADEVRAAIDAEVKSQMPQTAGQAGPDLAGMLSKLSALEAQLAGISAQKTGQDALADRLQALDERLAGMEARPIPAAADPAPLLALANRLETIASRLQSIEDHHDPIAISPVIDQTTVSAMVAQAVSEALPQQPPAASTLDEAAISALVTRAVLKSMPQPAPAAPVLDEAAISALVSRAVTEAVPRQASELLREAIAKLPTRDDLHQIAETLRADLDWRLEKAAAEHGWCSLSDVQSTVRKGLAEQDPSAIAGGSQLGRLEIALAEFVQQSKDQQDRLISALADRVAQKTKSMTKRILAHSEPLSSPPPKHETEELSPSLSAAGDGSSRMAAITGAIERQPPGKSPTDLNLDPVPPEALEATRRNHGSTTLFTQRVKPAITVEPPAAEAAPTAETVPSVPAKPEDLHDLVTAEVERALRGATASTMTDSAPVPDSFSGLRDIAPLSATLSSQTTIAQPTAFGSAAATTTQMSDLGMLVAAEVGRQLANTIPVQLPPCDSDLARAVARVLPQALQDESVRTELFAVLALEAAGKPGALGELTGLRRYLKRELQATASQLGMAPAN